MTDKISKEVYQPPAQPPSEPAMPELSTEEIVAIVDRWLTTPTPQGGVRTPGIQLTVMAAEAQRDKDRAAVADKEREVADVRRHLRETMDELEGAKAKLADLQTSVTLERERADRNAADAADLAALRAIWTANRWIEDSVERDAILNKKAGD